MLQREFQQVYFWSIISREIWAFPFTAVAQLSCLIWSVPTMNLVFKNPPVCQIPFKQLQRLFVLNWLYYFINEKELFFQLKIWTLISAESKRGCVNGQAAIRREY